MTEKNLLRLICILWGFAVLYLCFSDTWVHVVVETNLPVFWLYLGTCVTVVTVHRVAGERDTDSDLGVST